MSAQVDNTHAATGLPQRLERQPVHGSSGIIDDRPRLLAGEHVGRYGPAAAAMTAPARRRAGRSRYLSQATQFTRTLALGEANRRSGKLRPN
jgi:hypothetical protein